MTDLKGKFRESHAESRFVSARGVQSFLRSSLVLLFGMGLVACGSGASTPTNQVSPKPSQGLKVLGTVKVTINEGNSSEVRFTPNTALQNQTVISDNNTIPQLTVNGVCKGVNDAQNTYRIGACTFELLNNTSQPYSNLAQYFVGNPNRIGGTTFTELKTSAGVLITDATMARSMLPSAPADTVLDSNGQVKFLYSASDFQVLTAAEAQQLTQEAALGDPNSRVLQYGARVRAADGGRTLLPGSKGTMTIGWKRPWLGDQTIRQWQYTMILAVDPTGRITRAPGETTANAAARAQAVGATQLGLVGTDSDVAPAPFQTVRNPDPMYYVPDPVDLSSGVSIPSPVGTLGGSTVFDASGVEGEGLSYAWDFGDGTSSTDPYATHSYTARGTYPAKLTITDKAGRVTTKNTPVAVLPEIQDIVKQRASSNSSIVEFDAGDPIDGLTYTYDLGDGTTKTGSRISHTYSTLGTFAYTLTIRDTRVQARSAQGRSLSAQAINDDLVYKASSWHTVWRKAPVAKFTYTGPAGPNVAVGVLPLTVSFDAATSSDPNFEQASLTYAWDFGNGQTATTPQAQTTFQDQKAFLVTLKVTNKWGLSDTRRTFIHGRSIRSNFTLNARYPRVDASAASLSDPVFSAQEANAKLYTGPRDPSFTAQAYSPSDNVESFFPYVLPSSHNFYSGIHKPMTTTGLTTKTQCASYRLYVNGSERFPLYGSDADNFLCDYMLITAGNIGRLPVRALNTVLVSTSAGLYTTTVNVFSSLSVPTVSVSIVPDEFIPGEVASPKVSERFYTDAVSGKKKFLLNVLIRQSEAGTDRVSFKVPVLAVNEQGAFMQTINGIFNARFTNLDSNCGECVMVNGKAYINVSVVPAQYAFKQQQLDLTNIRMYGGNGDCNFDASPLGAASKNNLSGCTELIGSFDFPTSNAPTDIPAFPAELSKSFQIGNHIFYGPQADAAKALSIYAKVGYVLAHTYVEYTAPFLLIDEKREQLQKLTDSLVADGNLSPGDAAQISLASISVWASAIPAGPLKPPSYASVATFSRQGAGQLAAGFDEIVKPSATAGLKTSEVATLLNSAGKLTKAIEECGQKCAQAADKGLKKLIDSGVTPKVAVEQLEEAVKDSSKITSRAKNKVGMASNFLPCIETASLSASSIKVTDILNAQAKSDKCFKLVTIGVDTHRTPQGLIYGPDPSFISPGNRLEHLLKHTGDDLSRPLHGVFDSAENPLALIDEAFARIKASDPSVVVGNTRPSRFGPVTEYTVQMGRDIGFVGGSVGAVQGNPRTTYLLLVIRNGNEFVTGFPKG